MPDYNYDNHRFQPTDDRSKNYAQSLDGTTYHLDVTLQADWPGLGADPHKQRFDVQKMNDVARWIDEQIRTLQQGSYTPQSLPPTASVSYGPTDWNAANNLKAASGEVAKTVSDYANKLIVNLNAASAAIKKAAAHYGGAEQTNLDSMTSQQNSLAGQPSPTSWT